MYLIDKYKKKDFFKKQRKIRMKEKAHSALEFSGKAGQPVRGTKINATNSLLRRTSQFNKDTDTGIKS